MSMQRAESPTPPSAAAVMGRAPRWSPGRTLRCVLRRAGIAGLGLGLVGLVGVPALASVPNPPNDPEFTSQWALQVMKAPQAWSVSTGAGVVVAVVDTGVAFGIPDLPASKSAGSYDCINSGSGPCPADTSGDPVGHGTYVASIIAAQTNNGEGIAAVAPDATIMSVKAMGSDGTGSITDIAKAIRFSADEGARVVNLSAGPEAFATFQPLDCPYPPCLTPPTGSSLQTSLQPSIDYATAKGALVVLAAGNATAGTAPTQSLYMGLDNVLVVGATGPRDEAASYSDTGSGPTFIWAPGGDGSCAANETGNCIVMDSPSGQSVVDEGTSFAAPQVSGVAALLMADGYSNSGAASRMQSTADSVAAGPRVDAASAVGASSAPMPVVAAHNASLAASGSQGHSGTLSRSAAAGTSTSPVPVAASPAVAAAAPASPAPVPSPSQSPQVMTAADGPARPKTTVRLAGRPAPRSGSSLVAIALVAFLAAAGAAGTVALGKRARL